MPGQYARDQDIGKTQIEVPVSVQNFSTLISSIDGVKNKVEELTLASGVEEFIARLEAIQLPGNLSATHRLTSVEKYLAAAGDYAANDVLSEHATAGTQWQFNGLIDKAGDSCRITDASVIIGVTNLTPRLSLQLYTQKPACVLNDNVENTGPVLADRQFYLGQIDFPALEDIGTGMSAAFASISTVGNLPILVHSSPSGLAIHGVLVIRDAETDEAANMIAVVKLVGEVLS